MTQSYRKPGAPVKQATAPGAFDRSAPRSTATFVPYYWEAYNEIVEPRRYDHYLIQKWQRELGPVGFSILKNLRDRCYHNPAQGVLRDTCEVDLQELGESIGVSRSTVIRELRDNAALGQFLQRVRQFRLVDGRPQKDSNRYRVCMDDPIHPDDLERYDLLRAAREIDRQPLPQTIIKGKNDGDLYKGQNEPYRESAPAYKGHFDPSNTSGHFDPTTTSGQNDPSIDYLPSGSLTKENLTPPGGPPINPPRGNNADSPEPFDPLQAVWSVALAHLCTLVNGPTLNAHLKPMRLVSIEGDTSSTTELCRVTLLAPSAFTRNWIEGRNRAEVEAALAEALGKPVTAHFTTGGK